MLDFWCPYEGTDRLRCVLIKIPKVCCGIRSCVFIGGPKTPSSFVTILYCLKHMDSYKDIWMRFGFPQVERSTIVLSA